MEGQFFTQPVVMVCVKSSQSLELMKFQTEHNIWPLRGYGYYDPTTSIGFFLPEDAEKLIAFLQEKGLAHTQADTHDESTIRRSSPTR